MRVTAILFPAGPEGYTITLPALPGCLSEGDTREEALANVREAALGWLEVEAEEGRGPVPETAELLAEATAETLQLMEDMRLEGEIPQSIGFPLELIPLELAMPSHR